MLIEQTLPDENLVTNIEDFFNNLEFHPLKEDFLDFKKRDKLIHSDIDIQLIAFSKEMGLVLISND